MTTGRGTGKTTKTIRAAMQAASDGQNVAFVCTGSEFIHSVARPIMANMADQFSADTENRVKFISAKNATHLRGTKTSHLYFDHDMKWEMVKDVVLQLPNCRVVFE